MSIDFQQVSNPCFVLETSKLRRNLEILHYVQAQSGADIICALKGFSMFSTFPLVRQYLKGATASSLHEARLAHEEMGGEVHAYAPAYEPDDFAELMTYCNHISFNSLSQWERFKPELNASHKAISCGLRINPEYSEVEVDLYNPCIRGSRFGVRAQDLNGALPEGIEGLHFHTLCEQNADTLERTLPHLEKKFGKYLHSAKWLNMGGGHHITREDYDVELLIRLIKYMSQKYNLKIILEPGEAVGWQTGYLVSEILDIMDSDGIKVALLNVSFTAHMPDCLEMPYKPRVLGATDVREGMPTYRLGGSTCLAGDFMGDYSFDAPLSVGDKIIFDDMIHYTMVKTNTFNGVKHPDIGIWEESGNFRLVRRFTYEHFRNRLS
ncbi:MAG: carboxynorspermidine decarboxylase [Bernardetiaceae bacterium]|nr:carboxynorspermidine decarboxylase [Bernardetiaceae bacterium]